ncbi:MAG: transcriptional regulator, LysR family [Hyphomicrobiales bacterium]|nr:transcriptional regulator, LysR family [Hyphomicrobiales bacterium]
MRREDLVDLNAFLTVAEEESFTRAAARLGTSQSALSHTVRRLEERLGVRLLTRTTRRVAPTEAGERLLRTLGPALDTIASELSAVGDLRDRPAGNIRLTLSGHAARTIVWPVLEQLLPSYPDIHVELAIDSGLADIVAERFDAGVRLGEAIAKDMIAVRIGPDLRMAIVGSPSYFAAHPLPLVPQDLAQQICINLRLATSGGFYTWELQQGTRELRVRVDGQLAFNNTSMIVRAALSGFGLGFVMENCVADHVASGILVRVLEDWCPPFPGYHIYYTSRREPSAAFVTLVEALRYRG